MCTPILKPVFRKKKKSISTSFLTKNNFLEKFSRNIKSSCTCTCMKISYRSCCKSFNVLSVQWYQVLQCFLRFLLLFCCCTIECDHLHNACNIFMNEESWNSTCWQREQDSRWCCKEYFHDLFSFKSFHICSRNQKIIEWIVLLQSLKEDPSWNLLCHWNTRENATDFQLWS